MGASKWTCDICGVEYPDNDSFTCCDNVMVDEHQICDSCMEKYPDLQPYNGYIPAKICPVCKKHGWITDPDELTELVLKILEENGVNTADPHSIKESHCGGAVMTITVDPIKKEKG